MWPRKSDFRWNRVSGQQNNIKRYLHKSRWTLWLGLVMCVSVTQHLKKAIATNAFSGNLETHKTHNSPMITPRGVAKLSTSCKMTIFPPPVPYLFISDHCLKRDCWPTLFLRNSIVAMDLQNLQIHKIWIISRGETYVRINLLASTRQIQIY